MHIKEIVLSPQWKQTNCIIKKYCKNESDLILNQKHIKRYLNNVSGRTLKKTYQLLGYYLNKLENNTDFKIKYVELFWYVLDIFEQKHYAMHIDELNYLKQLLILFVTSVPWNIMEISFRLECKHWWYVQLFRLNNISFQKYFSSTRSHIRLDIALMNYAGLILESHIINILIVLRYYYFKNTKRILHFVSHSLCFYGMKPNIIKWLPLTAKSHYKLNQLFDILCVKRYCNNLKRIQKIRNVIKTCRILENNIKLSKHCQRFQISISILLIYITHLIKNKRCANCQIFANLTIDPNCTLHYHRFGKCACKQVYYCNKKCQKKHWKNCHKIDCSFVK